MMSDVVRIVSPYFSSFHDLSHWIDDLVSQPVPSPNYESLIVEDIVQISAYQRHRQGRPGYGATIFVSAIPRGQNRGC